MQSHPDADAFMRSYLAQPADATTRLIFADWLDETGEPHNAAWAHFIRLKAEAGRYTLNSYERPELDRQADACVPLIRARLVISAKLFVNDPNALLQLLPSPNITVRLAGFDIEPPIFELMPESLARENLVVPLDLRGRTLLVATADPHNSDTAQKLEFILNKDIILLHAERDDVRQTIDDLYGHTETESVVSVSYESPLVGLEGDEASGHLGGVFHTAFSSAATSFTMKVTGRGCAVRYYAGKVLLSEDLHDPNVYDRLLEHLLAERLDADYMRSPYLCADLDVPLLSGRRFPVTLERPLARDARWFRLRFRW